MILGKPTKLSSQFRVTYNMILNLLRVEAIKVEDMIKRSFSENSTQKSLPLQEELRIQGEKILKSIKSIDCTYCSVDLKDFYDTSSRILSLTYFMNAKIINSSQGNKALAPGRIVVVNNAVYRNCVGVLIGAANGKIHNALQLSGIAQSPSAEKNTQLKDDKLYWVLVLKSKKLSQGSKNLK
jgi:antiviral helicase SKI2